MSAPLTTSAATLTADAGRTSKPCERDAKTHDAELKSSKSPPNTYASDPPSMPPPKDATLRTFGAANRSTNACTPPRLSKERADACREWSIRTATKRESEPASTMETDGDSKPPPGLL